MLKVQQFLTLTEHQLKDLNRLILILSVILFFSGSYIANYISKDANSAWDNFSLILRFNYWLLIIALRSEFKNLIGELLFNIVKWIIINNFIDRYFGLETWSWNDIFTVYAILLEYYIYKNKGNG